MGRLIDLYKKQNRTMPTTAAPGGRLGQLYANQNRTMPTTAEVTTLNTTRLKAVEPTAAQERNERFALKTDLAPEPATRAKYTYESVQDRINNYQTDFDSIVKHYGATQSIDGSWTFKTQAGLNAANALQKELTEALADYNGYYSSLAGLQERANSTKESLDEAKKVGMGSTNRFLDWLGKAAMVGQTGYFDTNTTPHGNAKQQAADAEVDRLQVEYNKIRSDYYYSENKAKLEGMSKADSTLYAATKTLSEDTEKISVLMDRISSGDADLSDVAHIKAYLTGKYGLKDFTYKGVGALHSKLSADLQDMKSALSKRGYNFDRLAEYEGKLEQQERIQKQNAAFAQFADNHEVLASAASVLASPLQGADYLDLAIKGIGKSGDDLSTYVPMDTSGMAVTNFVSTVRNTVSKEIEENTNWELFGTNVFSFLYQTGMSIADSATQVAAMGPYAVYVMGMSAASNQAKNIIERGGTNGQALIGGLAAGAAEVLFEKISIDNLLKARNISTVKDWLMETAKQAGTEASEEVFTELSNIISDAIIMGQNSEYNNLVAYYQTAEGGNMSAKEAKKQALLDYIGQVALAGIGGALSGGVMGGTVTGVNVFKAKSLGQNLQTAGALEQVQLAKSFADESDKTTMMRLNAIEAELEKGGTVDAGTLGAIAMENMAKVQEVVQQAKEYNTPELNAALTMLYKQGQNHGYYNQEAVTKVILATSNAIKAGATTKSKTTKAGATASKTETVQTADTALEIKAAATQVANPQASVQDAGTTLYLQMGMSLKKAQEKSAIVQKLIAGEEVSKLDLNKINLTDKNYRQVFTQLTGVEFPSNTPLSTEALRNLAESAHTVTQQAAVQAQAQDVSAPQTQQVMQGIPTQAAAQAVQTRAQENPAQMTGNVVENQGTEGYTGGNNNTEVVTYGEQAGENLHLRESGQRNGSQNPGGPVRQLEEAAGRDSGRGKTEYRPRDEETASLSYGSEVSTAELGLKIGSRRKTMRLVKGGKTESMRQAESLAKKHGLKTVFFSGSLEMKNGDRARGCIDNGTLYIRVDSPEFTADQITRHEIGHHLIRTGEISLDKVRERLHQVYSDADLDKIIDIYLSAYNGVTMTAEEAFEEIVCDALGGMNIFAETGLEEAWESVLANTYQASGVHDTNTRNASAVQERVQGQLPLSRETKFSREGKNDDRARQEKRVETREAFLRRAAGEGFAVYEGATTSYGYRPIRDATSGRAKQVQEEIKNLGVDAEIISGNVLWNRSDTTSSRNVPEAVTISGKHILISNETTIPPRRTAGHEVFHLWKNGVEREAYIEVIEDNLLFTSKAFLDYQSEIAEAYLGGEVDLTNDAQMAKLREELFAYISGDIHEGINDDYMRPMFRDFDAVKQAWQELVRANAPGYQFDNINESTHATGEDAFSSPKFSRETNRQKDREYMTAVENGDMETAQRMVDEAAKAAGYDTKLYHGTKDFGFTKFNPKFSDDKISLFVSNSNDVAQTYSGTYDIKPASTKPKHYRADKLTDEQIRDGLSSWKKFELVSGAQEVQRCVGEAIAERWSSLVKQVERHNELVNTFRKNGLDEGGKLFAIPYADDRLMNARMTPERMAEVARTFTAERLEAEWGKNAPGILTAKGIGELAALAQEETLYVARDSRGKAVTAISVDMAAEQAAIALNARESNGNYALYGKTEGLLVVDGKGANWNHIPFRHAGNEFASTRDIVSWAHEHGYTGVRFKDIVDNSAFGRSAGASDVYAFFDGKQLKSADPVTYNRLGKVIPLSKRFNENRNDIRFSRETSLSREGIPDEVIFSARYSELISNGDIEDYNKAKQGDVEAAARLIRKYVTEENVAKIAAFGENVYLLPVQSKEGNSKNVIPQMLGQYISSATGQPILKGVFQSERLNRRKQSNIERLTAPDVTFDISDESVYNALDGAEVVGIDDNTSYGSTLRGLAKFLQEHGAKMVGSYVLTVGGDNSEAMVVTDETWQAIEKEGVENVEQYARSKGYTDAFTREQLGERRAQDFLALYQNDQGRRPSDDRGVRGNRQPLHAVSEGQQYAPETLPGSEEVNQASKASDDSGAFSLSKFSREKPVEQVGNLIALHNLNAGKLNKVLDLGGFPMPSIAVTRTDIPHTNFGDITLVMNKSTIDPKANRKNTVYSADAWTPTVPPVSYKPSEKRLREIKKTVYDLVGGHEVISALDHIAFDEDNISRALDQYDGDLTTGYRDNNTLRYAFLKDSGADIELPSKEENLYRYGEVSNAAVKYFAGKLADGLRTVDLYQNMGSRDMMQDEALRKAVADALNFDITRNLEEGSEKYEAFMANPVFKADEVSFSDIDGLLSASRKYFTGGTKQTINRSEASKLLKQHIADNGLQEQYEAWLAELFDGVVEKTGIYNNKDIFTPSGNRRSFEQLHMPVTLENIVKAMASQNNGNTKNVAGFNGVKTLRAGMAKRFKSIAEMHNLEERLQNLTEEEFEAIHDQLSERMFAIINRIIETGPKSSGNSFMRMDSVGEMMMEIAESGNYSLDNIVNTYKKYQYNVGTDLANDVKVLLFDVSQMPTNMFEAKPERVVGFDEVLAAIVPDDTDQNLISRLKDAGVMNVTTYAKGDDADRLAKVNDIPEALFSREPTRKATAEEIAAWKKQWEELQIRKAKEKLEAEKEKARVAAKQAREDKMKALADQDLAWNIHHTAEIRAGRQRGKEKLAEQRRELNAEKRKAVSETKEIERATAAAHREADTVMMKAKAAERLRRNDERWKQKADENRNRWNLKRKAAAKALSDSKKVAEKRNAHETEQGMVNTIRKAPGDKKYVERLQESATNLRTLGRAAYRNFVSRTADIEAFGRRQASGIRADTLVNIVGATPTTIEHIFKSGLVDRNGNRIGGSMKEVFLVMGKRGRVDEKRQALLQDYMLHLHNTDRMGIEDKALDQLHAYEVENPWLLEMDPKEFALLVGMTETEVKKTGKQEAQKRAVEYAKLLDNYNTAENKPIFPDEDGNPVTAKTSRGIVEKYLQENPWLEEKANGIYEWWDLFMKTWAIGDSLTRSQYDAMREMYPHYVPTYRVQDKTGAAVSVAVTGARPGQAVKRATGGLSQVMNIEDGFSQLVSKIVKLNRVNEFYKNIVDTAMLDESGDFWDMAVFDWDSVAKKDVPLLRPDFADQAEDADAVGLEKTEHGDYRLSAWYDGKLYSCFLSEDMFKAISDIAGKTNSDLERILLKAGNALTGAMKTAITGINPTFALRNISRDIPTAIVNSISGFAFPKYWAKALNEMRKNSDRWQQFRALGGTHAEYYNQEQGFANAMAERRGAGAKVVGALGWFNEVTEAQTRFAEYLATIDRLGDTYENRLLGIKNSAEVTVDFSRKGKYGKVINAWVPYWNPAVQGIDKTIRSVIESKDGSAIWRKAVVTIGRAAVINVLAEAVLYAVLKALGRYDDWEELDDRTKDTYYCIPLPTEHKFLKIPRNREWGAILGAPIQRILEYANGRENPFENYVQTALQPNFMAGNIVPVWDGEKWSSDMIIVSQALDLAQNKNFYGSSIVPYAYQQGSATEQYDSETSILGRALGELLNFSPMQIDYLISDYFGDFGDLFINATSEATWAGDNTVVDLAQSVLDMVTDPFLTNSQYSNRSVSKYYDTLDELEKVVQDKKNQMGSDAYKNTVEYQTQTALNKLYGNTISELNKEVRNLPDGEEKDALKEQIATIAAAALEYYDQCMSGEIANPVLDATYSTVSDHISDELIRLDAFADDYAFEPTYSPSKTYTDPSHKTREYNLEEDQRDYLKELFLVEYDKQVTELLNSSKYKNLSDEKKAEKIAEVRSDAIEAAKEQFFDWLEETGVRSTKKD